MTVLRVTPQIIAQSTLQNLNGQIKKILELQEQLATGLKVNSPSDDATATGQAISARTAIAKQEQYLANMSAVGPQLSESESVLDTVIDVMQRAYELTTEGANGTFSQTQLDEIATEINQLLETVVSEGNHITDNRYIFAGTRTLQAPFEATRDADGNITAVAYVGNDESIEVAIGDNVSLVVNETGYDAFQSTQDIFQLLIDIRDDLSTGDQGSLSEVRLAEIDTAIDQLLMSLTRVGSIEARIESTTASAEDSIIRLKEVLSDAIDADYAETVVNLNVQSNAYQAALDAASRVIQPSLLDYT